MTMLPQPSEMAITAARKRRDDRVRVLTRMTKRRLAAMYRQGVRGPSGGLVQWAGGQNPPEKWTKDELVSTIIEIEHPQIGQPR